MKTFLPEMTPPAMTEIDPSRVTPIRLGKGLTQPVMASRHHDNMNMIEHQTLCPAPSVCHLTAHSNLCEIHLVAATIKEDLLPSISPPGDVMQMPGYNNPWNARHTVPP
jgi:hypothetical protein